MIPTVTSTGASLEVDDPAVLAALYDPLRYRIFRALEEPTTIAELAGELGKPANRLYYHVRLLAEAGLVRQVGTRARGRHTERVFGRAAERVRLTGDLTPGAGGGLLGAIAQELDDAIQHAPAEAREGTVSYHVVRLTPERARELERRLSEVVDEFEGEVRKDPGTRRYGLLGAVVPLEATEAGLGDS